MTGAVVSTTVTFAEQADRLSESSCVENWTGVATPTGNSAGAAALIVNVASHTSVALAPARNADSCASVFGVPPVAVHSTWIGAGQTMAGSVVSRTWTV